MIYLILLLPAAAALIAFGMRQWSKQRSRHPVFEPIQTGGVNPLGSNSPFDSTEPAVEQELLPPTPGTLPYSILIVDDQSAIRRLLRELFELEGYTVYEAPQGRTAIEQVQRYPIDFILLDLKMPDMDGIEALMEIRKFNTDIKVAMITAYGDPDKIDTAKQLGVLNFFTKPFDIEHVKQFVISELQGSESPKLEEIGS